MAAAMDEDSLRSALKSMLEASFPNVSTNEFGSVVVSFPDNPVGCKVSRLPDGSLVVNLESPILLDVPSPQSEVYELICLLQKGIPFGSLIVVGGSSGDIHMLIRGQLLADGLAASHLTRAVALVHGAAVAEIGRFRELAPPIGGVTAYGS
jgi:hypothetical protein